MTKSLQLLTALLFAGILGANAQLFPKVSKPESNEASMLVLQFGHTNDGKLETITNLNFSGWAPAVLNANGRLFPLGSTMQVPISQTFTTQRTLQQEPIN